MAGPIGRLPARSTRADHHVEPVLDQPGDHGAARSARRRWRRRRPARRCRHRSSANMRRTTWPLPWRGSRPHDRAGRRGRPRRCGRWNCCRRHRWPRPAAPRGNRRRPCRSRPPRCSRAPAPRSGSPAARSQPGLAPRFAAMPRSHARSDVALLRLRPHTCPVTIAFLCSPVPCRQENPFGRRRPVRKPWPPPRSTGWSNSSPPTWSGSTRRSCRAPAPT